MPRHDFFSPGEYNAQCDICSRTWKSGSLRTTWDNYRTCQDCWYPRNPQDFLRGIPDNQAPLWVRPLVFIFVGEPADDPGHIGGAQLGNYDIGGP